MFKQIVSALAAFLVAAAVTFGQGPDSLLTPVSMAQPVPFPEGGPAPSGAPSVPAPQGSGAPSGTPVYMAPPNPITLPVPAPDGAGGPSGSVWDAIKNCLCPNACDCHTLYTVDAEYLMWFFANNRTTVPAGATGPLGQPGTSVLVPLKDPEHSSTQPFQGGRLSLGWWLVEDNPWFAGGIRDLGVEANFFFLGSRSFSAQNDQASSLVRPFSDVNSDQESGFLVTAPGVATGGVSAYSQLSNLWGSELNLWKNLYYDCPGTIHSLSAIAGFRYMNADYLAQISSVSNFNPALPASSPYYPLAGDTLSVLDSFTTHNQFYGGQVGIVCQAQPLPGLMLQAGVKLALGVTAENLIIAGSQVRTLPSGGAIYSPGGVLALPSNIGNFERNEFAQIPELELKMAGRVTDHVTLMGGFSVLDWTRILRAVNQIDPEVDSAQIPNFPAPSGSLPTSLEHPAVLFQQNNLLALTLSLGLEVKW